MKLRDLLNTTRFFSPADLGSGGEAAASPSGTTPSDGDASAPDAGSVLFPNEGDEGEGKDDGAGGDDDTSGEGEGEGEKSGDGEGEADDDKSDKDDADGDDKDAKADEVPEDGKYDLNMPEGVEVDAELLEALGPDFKELGLTNGQAQKLADKFIEVQQKRAEDYGKTPEGQWLTVAGDFYQKNGTPDTWAEKAKADKEIGGDKWDDTVASAARAMDKLGSPELREYLNASGGGNHPALIKFASKVGALISEDVPAGDGAEGSGSPADPSHILFPSDKPKG